MRFIALALVTLLASDSHQFWKGTGKVCNVFQTHKIGVETIRGGKSLCSLVVELPTHI